MAWTTSGAIWCSGTRSSQPARERVRLLVGGEAVGTEAAEQPHHRQVELAVPAVGGRVDQPAAPVDVDDPVAGPQVAVEPGGRLRRAADLAQPIGVEPLERVDRARPGARAPSRARRASGAMRWVA